MKTRAVMFTAVLLAGCSGAQRVVPSSEPTPTTSQTTDVVGSAGTAALPLLSAPQPVFQSGFEDGVTLTGPKLYEQDWAKFLKGSDEGFRWESDLPQRTKSDGTSWPLNRYTNAVAISRPVAQVDDYSDLTLDTLPGAGGGSTRALKLELKKQDPKEGEGTRAQVGIYPPFSLTQSYLKYKLRLQADLNTVLTPGTGKHGLILTETKMAGSPRADFRWNLYAQADAATPYIYWRSQAQDGDSEDSPQVWECTSKTPVPVGKWMTVEVFWKTAKTAAAGGQVQIVVDGTEVVNFKGRTMKNEPVYVWWAWKLYVGKGLNQYAGHTFSAWVDDVWLDDATPSRPTPKPGVDNECRTF